jgi:hypothetical protein
MIDLSQVPSELLQQELDIRAMPLRKRRETAKAKLKSLRTFVDNASPHCSIRVTVLGSIDEILPLLR